jgi:hypothetical protein
MWRTVMVCRHADREEHYIDTPDHHAHTLDGAR